MLLVGPPPLVLLDTSHTFFQVFEGERQPVVQASDTRVNDVVESTVYVAACQRLVRFTEAAMI